MTARDNPTDLDALMPCPFCGSPAELEHHKDRWSVGCTENGEPPSKHECIGYISLTTFARKSEAVAAWNTRAAQPKPEVVERPMFSPVKTTIVATYEDLRWQLHTIAGHLRGMNRWKEATRIQKACDAMYPKGEIRPQPMVPRSHHG